MPSYASLNEICENDNYNYFNFKPVYSDINLKFQNNTNTNTNTNSNIVPLPNPGSNNIIDNYMRLEPFGKEMNEANPASVNNYNNYNIGNESIKQLEEGVERLTCNDFMNHMKNCWDCRNSVMKQLNVNQTNSDGKEENKIDDILEVVTFVSSGILLIMILDKFVKLGGRN